MAFFGFLFLSATAVFPEQKLVCKVNGMGCSGCARGIEGALRTTKGIQECKVSFEDGEAQILFNEKKTSKKKVLKALKGIGYQIKEINRKAVPKKTKRKVRGKAREKDPNGKKRGIKTSGESSTNYQKSQF